MIKTRPALFKWRHVEPEIIVCAVRWYLRFSLSYRDRRGIVHGTGSPCGPHNDLSFPLISLSRVSLQFELSVKRLGSQ